MKSQQLGLDELMIVNPATPGVGGLFEGEDGTLYQVQGMSEQDKPEGLGQLFLGDDGTLYRASAVNQTGAMGSSDDLHVGVGQDDGIKLGGYLLASDGALYEISK